MKGGCPARGTPPGVGMLQVGKGRAAKDRRILQKQGRRHGDYLCLLSGAREMRPHFIRFVPVVQTFLQISAGYGDCGLETKAFLDGLQIFLLDKAAHRE